MAGVYGAGPQARQSGWWRRDGGDARLDAMDDSIDIAGERPGWLRRLRRGAVAVGDGIADLALPPQCLACDRHVAPARRRSARSAGAKSG